MRRRGGGLPVDALAGRVVAARSTGRTGAVGGYVGDCARKFAPLAGLDAPVHPLGLRLWKGEISLAQEFERRWPKPPMTAIVWRRFSADRALSGAMVRALAREGWRVRGRRCAGRTSPDSSRPLGAVGQIEAVQANLRYSELVKAAIEGADAVVNAAGIKRQSGKQRYQAVHVLGAGAIARAAAAQGVGALVHVSGIGADAASRNPYIASKGLGETAAREAFPGGDPTGAVCCVRAGGRFSQSLRRAGARSSRSAAVRRGRDEIAAGLRRRRRARGRSRARRLQLARPVFRVHHLV